MTINYEPTAEAIREAAAKALQLADELNRIAGQCLLQQDLSYADEAVSAIANAFFNIGLNKIVMRPIRELDKEVVRLQEAQTPGIGKAAPR